MKVIFTVPTLSGAIESECVISLLTTFNILNRKNIESDLFVISNCPVLQMARNTLVAMFMKTDATDLFFVDSDVGFDAAGAIKILERPEKVVAGIYPLKQSSLAFPVQIKTIDSIPIGRDGLIEANLLPAGFMRVKRIVFEKMQEAYPELKYTSNVIDVNNLGITEAYDFFNMGISANNRWTTEDYTFCQRWTDIGGQLWVYPDIDFKHIGKQGFIGNYHQALLSRPKDIVFQMRPEKLSLTPFLDELHIENGIMAEIGSYAGESAEQFALSNKFSLIYAIDIWEKDILDPAIYISDMKNVENIFDTTILKYNNIKKIKKTSLDAVNEFPDKYFDLVYIDANHEYENAKQDIIAWMPKIKKDGVLAGHDYNDHNGVKQAVNELFGSPDKIFPDSSWIIKKRGEAWQPQTA